MAEKAEKKKSGREQNRENSKRKAKGQPRTWETEEELYKELQEFIDCIVATDYCKVPTLSEFRRWLKEYKNKDVTLNTICTSINDYFVNRKTEWLQMLENTLNEGAMLGHYQPATTIFALKNWCKWTDKQEIQADTTIRIELDSSLEDWAK